MVQTLTLMGDIPSKKNSKRLVYAGRRPVLISSKNYEAWHTIACYELKNQMITEKLPLRVHEIVMTFWHSTKRRKDLTNEAESVNDLLVDNGIIADDNAFEVPRIVLNFGGVDRNYPHAEIKIITINYKI